MGESITVDINVANLPPLIPKTDCLGTQSPCPPDKIGAYAFELDLSFDARKVKITTYTLGTFFPDWVVTPVVIDNTSGTVQFTISQLAPHEPVTGSGTLVSLTFQGLAVGSSPITLSNTIFGTNAAVDIPATWVDGNITVNDSTTTPTATMTDAASSTVTPTMTKTLSPTVTRTKTNTPSRSPTPTQTIVLVTRTNTPIPSNTPLILRSLTPTITPTVTQTRTPSATALQTGTITAFAPNIVQMTETQLAGMFATATAMANQAGLSATTTPTPSAGGLFASQASTLRCLIIFMVLALIILLFLLGFYLYNRNRQK